MRNHSRLPLLLALPSLLTNACADRDAAFSKDTDREPTGDSEAPSDTGIEGDSAQVESVPDAWSPPVHDMYELPSGMPTLNLLISEEAMARLDENPYAAPDERGLFVDAEGSSHEVDLNYRGAYALQSVMSIYDLRNWKVKFASDDLYLGRREWNFNYDPSFAQKLAYDLFRFAGVPVPGAQHVVLQVNGEYQGMYLQYEDPDNKRWLWDELGDDQGDLYKAAYDLPGEPQYFADLTWLGPSDQDYLLHYNKKTNDETAPLDYSVIREFTQALNEVPDNEFASWMNGAIDLDAWMSYLVVSNFISNWDSYPQRPKNYWLYENRRTEQIVFIPWDLDGTFSTWQDPTWYQMGTDASVLYNLLECDYEPPHEEEGRERPLARRVMAVEGQQQLYLERYRALIETLLSRTYLEERLGALIAIVEPEISGADLSRLRAAERDLRTFIERRTAHVEAELDLIIPN